MELGQHTGFVLAAYAVAGLVIAGLVLWAMLGYRAERRALDELEARLGLARGER